MAEGNSLKTVRDYLLEGGVKKRVFESTQELFKRRPYIIENFKPLENSMSCQLIFVDTGEYGSAYCGLDDPEISEDERLKILNRAKIIVSSLEQKTQNTQSSPKSIENNEWIFGVPPRSATKRD